VRIVTRGKSRPHIGKRCLMAGRDPAPVADTGSSSLADESRAAIGLDQAGGDLQQGRLAGPVAADQARPSPGETDSSTGSSSGVPPKVSAMSASWTSGGAIRAGNDREGCLYRARDA